MSDVAASGDGLPAATPPANQSEWPEDQTVEAGDAVSAEGVQDEAAVESSDPVVVADDSVPEGEQPAEGAPVAAAEDAAAETPAVDQVPAVDPVTGQDKPKANLKAEVFKVLSDYVTGSLKLGEGKSLTIQEIAKAVQTNRGAYGEKPSSGAVASLLKRWDRYGLVVLSEGPTAFEDFTEAARTDGVPATQAKYREAQKAARAAARDAAAAASTTVSQPAPTGPDASAASAPEAQTAQTTDAVETAPVEPPADAAPWEATPES